MLLSNEVSQHFFVWDNDFFTLVEKGRVVTNDTSEQWEIKSRLCCCYLALYSLSCFGVAYENRLVICLHWLFSLANPNGGVAFHIYYSPLLCSFCSDVDGVIWCLSQNLYQHGTITVNLVNVYKVQSRAAGLCSLCLVFFRLFFLFSCMCFMCASVYALSVCVFKEHGVCVCVWQRGAQGVIEECCRARRGRL